MPSQSVTRKACTETSCTRSIASCEMRGGITSSIPPSSYFAEKSYQSAFASISPGIDAIGSSFPSTLHSTSTPRTNSSTSTFSSCWNASSIPARSSSSLARLRDPDGRAQPRGLHEHGEPERILEAVLAPEQRDALRDGDPLVAQDGLEQVLVHAERRGRHARADVGHVRELEQPLHGPVLAERPVQHGKDDVDAAERLGDARGRHGQRLGGRASVPLQLGPRARAELPAPVAADLDRHRLVARRVERLDHRARRSERDLVLARAATHDDGDAEPRHQGTCDEPADDDRHRRAGLRLRAADRVLGEDDSVLARVGRVLLLHVDREARLLERLGAPSPRPGSSRPGSSSPSVPSRRRA